MPASNLCTVSPNDMVVICTLERFSIASSSLTRHHVSDVAYAVQIGEQYFHCDI